LDFSRTSGHLHYRSQGQFQLSSCEGDDYDSGYGYGIGELACQILAGIVVLFVTHRKKKQAFLMFSSFTLGIFKPGARTPQLFQSNASGDGEREMCRMGVGDLETSRRDDTSEQLGEYDREREREDAERVSE